MSSTLYASIMAGLSESDRGIIIELLARQNESKDGQDHAMNLVDDYTSDSDFDDCDDSDLDDRDRDDSDFDDCGDRGSDSSNSEEEYTPKPTSSPKTQKRGPGRPKKVLTIEQISAMEAKKLTGVRRGRPTKVRTEEELLQIQNKAIEKEQRRVEREVKYAMKSDEVVAKQYRLKLKREASSIRKSEAAEKALVLRQKRTEIHDKMMSDAAEYKERWNL